MAFDTAEFRLGLGTLRLPTLEVNGKKVPDEDAIGAIVELAVHNGIKYFDCAPTYCEGRCEQVMGKLLKPYRSEVCISSKIPLEVLQKPGDVEKYFLCSLNRLGTEYLDYYNFWAVKKDIFDEKALQKGFLKELEQLKKQGLVRHIGFSYHDRAEYIPWILGQAEHQGILFDALLSQYNLIDRSMEQSMHYAKRQGLKILVMGAAAGGKLDIDSACRFVWQNPDVDIMLTGADSASHLKEVIELEKMCSAKSLSEGTDAIAEEQIRKHYLRRLYCTGCGYCMPCPRKIRIPEYLSAWQRILSCRMSEQESVIWMKEHYIKQYGNPKDLCVRCHQCEKHCPQNLPIVRWIDGIYGNKKQDIL